MKPHFSFLAFINVRMPVMLLQGLARMLQPQQWKGKDVGDLAAQHL